MLYWWSSYGKFAPDQSGFYPLPNQVVIYYRKQAGLSRQALANRLEVRTHTLYYEETQGFGLDSISRLRELCRLLAIPPILFGLCTAPDGKNWWEGDYKPWPAGADGWPDTGKVMKHYRRLKRWTQVQLAEALGLQESSVRKMENANTGLDSLQRRRALQFLLGIPPLLLGLDTVRTSSQLAPAVATPTPHIPSLEQVQAFQKRLWSGYYTGPAQDKVPQVRKLLAQIDDILPQIPEVERPAWLEVQSLGYQWLGNVLREYSNFRSVLSYHKQAVEQARLANNTDLLSMALIRQMESAYILGQKEQAVKLAQAFVPTQEPDPVLRSGRAIALARVLALATSDQVDRSRVLRLVEQCQIFGNSYNIGLIPETGMLRHAEILLNLSTSARDRTRLLSDAANLLERIDSSHISIRHQTDIILACARVALARNECDQAVVYALDAWPLVSELQSSRYLPQFAEIYHTLLQSSYASSPQVARLGLLLFQAGTL